MKANEKMYRIICTTDPYNAGRYVGFRLNHERTRGIKVKDDNFGHYYTLSEAQKALDSIATDILLCKNDIQEFDSLKDLKEMYKAIKFPVKRGDFSWYKGAGFYCNDEPIYLFDKNDSYSYDIFNYSIVKAQEEE